MTGLCHRRSFRWTYPWHSTLSSLLTFAACTIVVAVVLVKELQHPMMGRGDIDQWMYQGYYFANHLCLTPIPQLDLANNDAFYPYGTSNVFRPWNFESAYFYAAGYWLWGNGPWIQWYFLISLFACAALVYLVVRNEFGMGWAAIAGFALSFGNYYALGRFPDHFGYSIVHWMTLSILLDFIIVRRFALERALTLRLLLLKCVVQTLCFGHDLGYVCGLSLTCSVVTLAWLIMLCAVRCRVSWRAWRTLFTNIWRDLITSATKHKSHNLLLAGTCGLVAVLYIPLVFQIFSASREVTGGSMPDVFEFSVARGRFLIPVMPERVTGTTRYFIGNIFGCRPGLFFVGAAVVGLAAGSSRWRNWQVTLPFVILLGLILTADLEPVKQTMKCLPWMAHVRSPGHYTIAMPVFLLVMAMHLPVSYWQGRWGRVFLRLGMCLLFIEIATACYFFGRYSPRHRFKPNQEFLQLAETISETAGEGLMEWPFSVISGNGIGNHELGIYNFKQRHAMAFQAFHGKKVMGSYFGRLTQQQIAPFLDAGWNFMFLPDSPRHGLVTRQHRDFTEEEWDFMESFFLRHDFCGVLIYPRLLHPDTVQGFHARFGPPRAVANIAGFGEVEFIPKQNQAISNLPAGERLRFRPPCLPITLEQSVTFRGNEGVGYLKSGWNCAESEGRWSHGPAAELAFSLETPPNSTRVLDLELHAFEGQPFRVFLNERMIGDESSPPDQATLFSLKIPYGYLQEANLLRIETPQGWPSHNSGRGINRLLGVQLHSLRIYLAEGRRKTVRATTGEKPSAAAEAH